MSSRRKSLQNNTMALLVVAGLVMSSVCFSAVPTSTQEALTRVADRLVADQITDLGNTNYGAWPTLGYSPGYHQGAMVAGLVDAYQLTCDPDYLAAAERGGDWILAHMLLDQTCELYYDEAYALMRLSEVSCEADYLTALTDFFNCVHQQGLGSGGLVGADWFIDDVANSGIDTSEATFQIAYYTLAAYSVDDPEKAISRDGFIDLLNQVANSDQFPIKALGAATWVLAQTGNGLDGTAITVGDPGWDSDIGSGPTYGNGYPGGIAETLDELPYLLQSYRVPAGQFIYGGHFYWLFIPQLEADAGYTEENTYAIMALDAATESDPAFDFQTDVDYAWAANMGPVDDDGYVWWNSAEPQSAGDIKTYPYAGEYLQGLAAAVYPGDLNLDDDVNLSDLADLADDWLLTLTCSECSIADLNHDGKVNLSDFARLAQGWMLSR